MIRDELESMIPKNSKITYNNLLNCYDVDYLSESIKFHYGFSEKDNLVKLPNGVVVDDAFIHLREFNQLFFMEDYSKVTHDIEFKIKEFKLTGKSHFIGNYVSDVDFKIIVEYNGNTIVIDDLSSLIEVTQGSNELEDFAKWALLYGSYMDKYIKYYLLKHLKTLDRTELILNNYYLTDLTLDGMSI